MMSNKEIFKKIFDEKFNSEKIKEEILSKEMLNGKIIKKKQKVKLVLKWSLVPICFIFIISTITVYGSKKTNKSEPNNILEPNNSTEIYINKVKEKSLARLDCDIKIISETKNEYSNSLHNTENDVTNFNILKDLKIPEDFDNTEYNLIYVSSQENNKVNNVEAMENQMPEKEYDILNNYNFVYSNTKNQRKINISFSRENEPIRDYFFTEENSQKSKINNIELKIYNYEETYFTKFIYNNYYFDIETQNITQEELITLLKSIIQ